MRSLIINADDLGISIEVDAQIEKGIKCGAITSSTIIANAPAFIDGVRLAKQYTSISIGVHLNIIEFAPLTNEEVFKKHGMLGVDGCFLEGAIFCIPIDKELKQAIYEEWDAQISKVEEVGIAPTHCDSHQHTHAIPALKDVLCQVLKKHGIYKVRRKMMPSIRLMIREKHRPSIKLDKSKAMLPKKRNVLYRRFAVFNAKYISWRWNQTMNSQYTMTDAFFSFRDFCSNRGILCIGGNDSIIELMCHPGHVAFQHETDVLLTSKSWLPDKYRLISYKDL